jgi:hypothetical protein
VRIKIGFTGSREKMAGTAFLALEDLVRRFVKEIGGPDLAEAHHGDCVGSDVAFHEIATELKIRTVAHPGDLRRWRAFCKADETRDPLPCLDRNRVIVAECRSLIACPRLAEADDPRSGTWATVRHARRIHRPVLIIWQDGRVESETNLAPLETP